MNTNQFNRFLAFLQRLKEAKISYRLQDYREGALSVLAFAPGEYWEIDFLAEGTVEIERFRSDGRIHDEDVLEQLFALWAEPETTEMVNEHDAIAGK